MSRQIPLFGTPNQTRNEAQSACGKPVDKYPAVGPRNSTPQSTFAVTAGCDPKRSLTPQNPPPYPPQGELRGGAKAQWEGAVAESAAGPRSPGSARLTPAGTAGAAAGERKTESPEGRGIATTLRPYQGEAIAAVQERWAYGTRRVLLVLATGLGKTVVASHLIAWILAQGARCLFLAHREELLEQTLAKLAREGVSGELEQANRRASLSALVVVASVQSLQRARLERFPRGHFQYVIVDEAHHAPARTYQAILEHFELARVLGLTATPKRSDGKALGDCFDEVAYRLDLREAIEQKWLAPITRRRIQVKSLDLRSIGKVAGDFHQGQLDAAMSEERVLHETALPLVEHAGDRRGIVFCVGVAHAHALASLLQLRYGRRAVALDGTTKKDERRDILRRYEEGEFQFLVNCALFTEGFDSPGISLVAVARPTLSLSLYLQMIGRGTRKAPGKVDCLILDFAGNSKHALIGAVDALAGDGVPADVRDLVESMLTKNPSLSVSDAIKQAESGIVTIRSDLAVVAVAAYRAAEVDPFLGSFAGRGAPGGGLINEAMKKLLADEMGMKKAPPSLTMAEAQRWLDGARARRRAGLATFPQAVALRRAHLDEKAIASMSRARADQLMKMLERGAPERGIKPWRASVLAHVPERKGNIR